MEIEDTFYNFLEEPCEETANELEDEDAVMLVVVANEVIESDDVVHIEDGDITYNVDIELAEQILDVLQEPYFPATLNGGVLMRNKDRVEMKEYEYYLVTDLLVSSFDVKKCEEIIVKLPNLTNLFIDGYFSAEMVVLHHPNLKKLTFDNYFNQPVNLNFPSLTHLTFRGFFNQTIGNLNVPNLTHLAFGNYFNQPIDNLNVPKLTHLTFGDNFNRSINSLNVPHLTHLVLGFMFRQPVDNAKFRELKQIIFDNIPVKYIDDLNLLLLQYSKKKFNMTYTKPISAMLRGGILKNKATGLQVGKSEYYLITVLTVFHTNEDKDYEIINSLPNLTYVDFSGYFEKPINNLNLQTLTHLTFGNGFNQPINAFFASNLTHLTFGDIFNQPITNFDLPKLTHLSFQWFPEEPFTNLNLPNLEYLDLGLYDGGQGYLQYIEGLNFPKLKEATINGQPIDISVFRRDTNLASDNVVSEDDNLIDAVLRDGKLMTLGGEEINEERYHLVTTLDAHVRPPTVTGYGYHHYYCGDPQDIRYDDDYDGAEDDDYDEMEKTDDCYYNYYGYDVNRRHHHRYNDDEMKEDEELISKLPNLTSLTRVDFDEPGICELVNCYYYEERRQFSREDSSEYLHYPKLTYLDLKNSYVNNLLNAHLPELKTFIFDNIEGYFQDNFPKLEFLDIHYFYAHPSIKFPKLTHLTIDKMLTTTISKEMFPSLTHLTFGDNFNEIVFLDVPTLTHLTFGHKFNQMIKYLNVPNLTHLTFGPKFNQPINISNFPNLTYLKISIKYKEYLSKIKRDKLVISYNDY